MKYKGGTMKYRGGTMKYKTAAGVTVATAAAVCLILVLFCNLAQARLQVKKLDYAACWKDYAQIDADKIPVKQYPYENCFKNAARQYDLPLTLLLALARGESDFNPKAVSMKSCYGIMQIRWPETAKELGISKISQLTDPCRNIQAGAKYFKTLMDRYDNDIHFALAAYNYGPGRIGPSPCVASLPQGAVWYSGYIYYHLNKVLQGAKNQPAAPDKKIKYRTKKKLPLIRFHNPFRAENFLAYIRSKDPDISLDWFRTSLGETCIFLVYQTAAEKETGKKRLEHLGFYVQENQDGRGS